MLIKKNKSKHIVPQHAFEDEVDQHISINGLDQENESELIDEIFDNKKQEIFFGKKNPITQEIENQAKKLVEKRSQEMMLKVDEELAQKKIEANQQIENMITEAKHEAEKIINEAHETKKTVDIEIYDARELLKLERQEIETLKYNELTKAYDLGMSQATEFINELMNYLINFQNAKKLVIEESKSEIMAIAFDLVKQILGHEATVNPQILEEQIENSIAKVITSKGIIQIFVNPVDANRAQSLETHLSKLLDPSVRLIVQADEEIDQGSCIVNTQGGRLDASFSGQIKVLKESFQRYLGYEIKDLEAPVEGLEIFEELEKIQLQEFKSVDNNINIIDKDIEDEAMSILELQDSKELGANDFTDVEIKMQDDDEFEDDDDEFEDDDLDEDEDFDEDEDDEDFDDEDEEEEEEFEDFDESEDEEEESGDSRFPEY